MSNQVKDRLIQVNQDFNDQMDVNIVFVDSLTAAYTEPSELGSNEASSAASPFKGKTTHECYILLQQLRQQSGSDIDYEHFAIMDERSLEDDTLLLAEAPLEEGGEAQSVRAAFELANSRLMVYLAGDTDVLEDQDKAQRASDRVLRPR